MVRPILLDGYCGEGGAGEGFAKAGFDVVGIDLNDDWRDRRSRARPKPLKRYPFPHLEMDMLEALQALIDGKGLTFSDGRTLYLADFSGAHASPPCQFHTRLKHLAKAQNNSNYEPVEMVDSTRELLKQTGLPYVIENVEDAPMEDPVLICGSMFDPPLDVRRHRLFETNWPLPHPTWGCRHKLWAKRYRSADYRGRKSGALLSVVPVYGGSRYKGDIELRRKAMEMPWASSYGLNEAIPPRYTEFIGQHLLAHVEALREVA
jgi:DNA (cytosine-5)-methyltransferase 1